MWLNKIPKISFISAVCKLVSSKSAFLMRSLLVIRRFLSHSSDAVRRHDTKENEDLRATSEMAPAKLSLCVETKKNQKSFFGS